MKRRTVLTNVLLFLLISLLCLFILEYAARVKVENDIRVSVSDNIQYDDNQDSFHRIEAGVHLFHEPFAERFPTEKDKSTLRVIFIGDSMTAGEQVQSPERFTALLESWLNERSAHVGSDLRYEVFNFAISGYNLEQMERVFSESLLFDPDMIVYNYYINDWHLVILRGGPEGKDYLVTFDHLVLYPFSFPGNGKLLSYSWAYRLLNHNVAKVMERKYPTFTAQTHGVGSDIGGRALRRMLKLAEKQNIPFVISIAPQLEDDRPEGNESHTLILAECRGSAVIWDLTHRILLTSPHALEELRMSDSDPHPNVLGHRAISEAFQSYFNEYVVDRSDLNHLVPSSEAEGSCQVV